MKCTKIATYSGRDYSGVSAILCPAIFLYKSVRLMFSILAALDLLLWVCSSAKRMASFSALHIIHQLFKKAVLKRYRYAVGAVL